MNQQYVPAWAYDMLQDAGEDMAKYRAYPVNGAVRRWWLRLRCPHWNPIPFGPGAKICRRCGKRLIAPGPR